MQSDAAHVLFQHILTHKAFGDNVNEVNEVIKILLFYYQRQDSG